MAVVAGADASQSLAAWVVFAAVLTAVLERERLLDRSEPAVVGPIERQRLESSFLASRVFEAVGNQRKRGGPADSLADRPAGNLAGSLEDNLGDNPALAWGSVVEEQLAGVAEVSLSQPV